MRLDPWLNSDRQGLTAFLEDIQASVCDVVISDVSVVLSFLTERSDEDGVVLRGDEGDGVEIDESGHGHGDDDDQSRSHRHQAGGTPLARYSTARYPFRSCNLHGP